MGLLAGVEKVHRLVEKVPPLRELLPQVVVGNRQQEESVPQQLHQQEELRLMLLRLVAVRVCPLLKQAPLEVGHQREDLPEEDRPPGEHHRQVVPLLEELPLPVQALGRVVVE